MTAGVTNSHAFPHFFCPHPIGFIGGGNGNPLQYSCWDNSMGRGGRQATVHGVTESDRTECLSKHRVYNFAVQICSKDERRKNLPESRVRSCLILIEEDDEVSIEEVRFRVGFGG